MHIVLLSGGSGKRLYPLSNDARSKQFLRVLRDQNGNKVSMLQRVWKQIAEAGFGRNAHICAGKSHLDAIQSQLGSVSVIQEPSTRDTFPAVALSTLYLHDELGVSDDTVVAMMPVDPMVNESFFATIRELEEACLKTDTEVALMGVTPTSASTKFGYVKAKAAPGSKHLTVEAFTEKPSEQEAERLIANGALWNCGVFAFKIGFMRQLLDERNYPATFASLLKSHANLPKISFDYEVLEKAQSIVVLPYSGPWKDLGTWDALTEEIDVEFDGLGTIANSSNTHVINEMNVPLIVNGVRDLVVVASPDGILVSDKASSSSIKTLANQFTRRPMYEERRWGTYQVLDHRTMEDGTQVLVKNIVVSAGKNLSYQKHFERKEKWVIVRGTGVFASSDGIRRVSEGDVLEIEIGDWHGIKAITELEFVEVQQGTKLVEQDIVRGFMTWQEIEEYFRDQDRDNATGTKNKQHEYDLVAK